MTKQTEKVHQRNEALIALREERNWNQFIAAQICRVHRSTYGAWERGEYRPSVPHLRKLAEVFEATPEKLGYALTEAEQEEWMLCAILGELAYQDSLPPRAQALLEEIAAMRAEERGMAS